MKFLSCQISAFTKYTCLIFKSELKAVFCSISATSSYRVPNFKVNYDLTIRNDKEFNMSALEGESKIEKTKDGACSKVLYFVLPLSTHLCFLCQKPVSFFKRSKIFNIPTEEN